MNLTFDFAFEGFRLIRERPKLIAFWGAICLFGWTVIALIIVQMAGPAVNRLMQMSLEFARTGSYDLVAAATLNQQITPAIAACIPIYILMSSVLRCAICRASFGETNDSLGFLSFGLAEIRMIAVTTVTLVLLASVFFGIVLAIQIVALSGNAQVQQGLSTLSLMIAVGVAVWLGMRLSLNVPQTFESGRLNIFGSLYLTRDRFWSLFTGYITAFALAQVVRFLCDKVIEAIQILSSGMKVTGDILIPNMTSVSTLMAPHSIILMLLTFGVIAPLMAGINFGAPVAAYRALRDRGEARKAEEKLG